MTQRTSRAVFHADMDASCRASSLSSGRTVVSASARAVTPAHAQPTATRVRLHMDGQRAASGVATASWAERPAGRVASHLDPLAAPRTGPDIGVVREGRDGSQPHPGVNVPIEEIHLHEVISVNGHVVPPSRLPPVLCTPWSRRLIRPLSWECAGRRWSEARSFGNFRRPS